MNDSDIRVFMSPDYTASNPYQEGLIDGLAAANVETIPISADGVFPILRAWVSFGRPDLVHLHWMHRFIEVDRRGKRLFGLFLAMRTLFELLVLRLAGIPVVWTVHNVLSHERRIPRIERTFRCIVARLVVYIIVHCQEAESTVCDSYRLSRSVKSRVRVIPHGNYDGYYNAGVDQESARRALDIPLDRTVLMFFGQIRRYKRVPELVGAFSKIEGSNADLWVVGNPRTAALRQDVERAAQESPNVTTVLDYVDDSQVGTYLTAADAIVLPYDGILTSGSAILAMTFGRAVIAPASGCLPGLLGQTGGITFDPNQCDGLREALEQAMRDVDRLHRMGERNRNAASKLSWSQIGKQTAETYAHAMESR